MSLNDLDGINNHNSSKTTYTEKECHNYIKKAFNKYGKDVTTRQFENDDNFPSHSTVIRVLGLSWNEIKKKYNGVANQEPLEINDFNPFTSAEAYIVGVILGDGCIARDYRRDDHHGDFRLSTVDKDFGIEVGKQLCKLLSLEWNGWDSDKTKLTTFNIIQNNKYSKSKIWRVCKTLTGDIFKYLFRYQNLNGEGIIQLENEFQWHKKDLVRGLWDSEGSINKQYANVRFVNTNQYIVDLYMKLTSDILNIKFTNPRYTYGIFSTRTEIRKGGKDIYSAALLNRYANKFFKEIDPTIERKRKIFMQHM